LQLTRPGNPVQILNASQGPRNEVQAKQRGRTPMPRPGCCTSRAISESSLDASRNLPPVFNKLVDDLLVQGLPGVGGGSQHNRGSDFK